VIKILSEILNISYSTVRLFDCYFSSQVFSPLGYSEINTRTAKFARNASSRNRPFCQLDRSVIERSGLENGSVDRTVRLSASSLGHIESVLWQ
jgi:hypothetical protein